MIRVRRCPCASFLHQAPGPCTHFHCKLTHVMIVWVLAAKPFHASRLVRKVRLTPARSQYLNLDKPVSVLPFFIVILTYLISRFGGLFVIIVRMSIFLLLESYSAPALA